MTIIPIDIRDTDEHYDDILKLIPKLRGFTRTQVEYEGTLPEYEDVYDHIQCICTIKTF